MAYFGVSGLNPHWSFEIQKSRVLVSFLGVLSKVLIRGRTWEVEETVYHLDFWRHHIRNVHLLVTL